MLLRMLRMFRVARLVRLVRSAKGVRTLLLTIGDCIPALLNVCSMLLLVALIYATVGMSLFGAVIEQKHLNRSPTRSPDPSPGPNPNPNP